MNPHALLLLYSISTAIAIPFNSDSQLVDFDPQPNLLADVPTYQADAPIPLDSNSYTSPGSVKDFSVETPSSSIPPNSQLQLNQAPVSPSATGDDVCCEPGPDTSKCRKQVGIMSTLCNYPDEIYNCPDGYKGDLNGCNKLGMAARKQPSWPGIGESVWFLGLCFRKPKPPLCPEFFNKLGGS